MNAPEPIKGSTLPISRIGRLLASLASLALPSGGVGAESFLWKRSILRCRACGRRALLKQWSNVVLLEFPPFEPWELHPIEDRQASPRDRIILCARCGRGPARKGAPLRSLAERSRQAQGELETLALEVIQARCEHWIGSLTLADFRSLHPQWFAALWEGGPSPEPDWILPRDQPGRVKFFLRRSARPLPLERLAPAPRAPREMEARALRALAAADSLATQGEGMEAGEVLDWKPYGPPEILHSLGVQLLRSASKGCYWPAWVDPREPASALRQAMGHLEAALSREPRGALDRRLLAPVLTRVLSERGDPSAYSLL